MSEQFDFDKAVKDLRSGKDLTGQEGILTPLIKQLTEAVLQGELTKHLESEEAPNRRNGTTSKTVKQALEISS